MNATVKSKLLEACHKLPVFIFGPMFSALGVSLCLKARLGIDPTSLFIEGISKVLGMAYSNASLLYNGTFIVLACIIFSLFASSPPAVDPNAAAVTQVWTYVGELIFNLLVLVGTVKMADRVVRETMGL